MSTTPKGPSGGDGGAPGRPPRTALDQTFLGVAPPLPVPTPAAAPAGAPASAPPDAGSKPRSGGSAIIATPMISVSGETARKNLPGRPPAAHGPGTPGASSAPGLAPQAPGARAPSPATNLQGGWQSANVMPRPASADQTMLQGSPRGWAAPASPGAPPRPAPTAGAPAPASPDVRRPVPPRPAPAEGGVQRTALASEYLRAARDAALGASAVPRGAPLPPRPGPPGPPPEHWVARGRPAVPRPSEPRPASLPAPVTQPPSELSAPPSSGSTASTAVPAHPALVRHELQADPPAPLSSPAAVAAPAAIDDDGESLAGPESLGTQASIAPPLLEDPAARPPLAAPAPMAVMAPAPRAPLHHLAMAGTVLEPALSLPAPLTPPMSAPIVPPSVPPGDFATRFEHVPSVRAPLSEPNPASIGVHVPVDQSLADWTRTGAQQPLQAAQGKAGRSQLRLILLAAVAVAAIGFAAFGPRLMGSPPKKVASRPRPAPAAQPGAGVAAPDQTTLANLPAPPPSAAAPPVTSTTTLGAVGPGDPTSEGSGSAAAERAADLPPPNEDGADLESESARAAAEADTSQESRLAADAGRHAIAGRYAEALPLYQALERSYPENTAYSAMVRVLRQKLGTSGTAAPSAVPHP